jgi:hypothetical protein
MRSIGIVLLVASFAVACTNGQPATPTPTTPVSASTATPAVHKWGEPVTVTDGAVITVSQPRRTGAEVIYTVTVHNTAAELMLTNVATSHLTADGVAADEGETIDNDPGYQLAVPAGQTITYTVKRTKLPATARTMSFSLYVNYSNELPAIDRPYWNGDIEG